MGKPGNKNQSSNSNIFKRVPNYNYQKESSEAIVPGIGGMGEQSSENVYMSDAQKSPLQQAGISPLKFGNSPLKAITPEIAAGNMVSTVEDDPFNTAGAAANMAGVRAKHTGAPTGAMGSDTRKQQYDDLGWKHDDTIAGDHEGSWQPKADPATANVEEPAVASLEDAQPGDVTEGEGGNAVMLDEVTVEAAPKGRAKRIANVESKIKETIGDNEDGTTSDKNQAKAKRLSDRRNRMKKRAGKKAKRVARRERVKEARQEPMPDKEPTDNVVA